MAVTVVIGTQWGDEGKGRVSNDVSKNAEVNVRANGGANAGHTVVVGKEEYKLHLLPSSIVNPECISVIAGGVALDLEILKKEIKSLRKRGIKITSANLKISSRAHIVMDWYKILDAAYEGLRIHKIGTTKRGIGPAYSAKALRVGVRMGDLVNSDAESLFKLISQADRPTEYVYRRYQGKYVDVQEILEEYLNKYVKFFKEFVCDTTSFIHSKMEQGKDIIIEGAQATGLDIDHGTYPYVTSSGCSASALCAAIGIGPCHVTDVYGVMKTYTSRVGEGPFPTELFDETGKKIRQYGHEYGTTTRRPRRCGWLDLVWLKYAVRINGVTKLCINHFDTIGRFDKIKVCVAYNYKGKVIDYVPDDLENCTPIYKEFEGNWFGIKSVNEESEPSKRAKEYLEFIEDFLGVKALYLGWGPEQNDMERL